MESNYIKAPNAKRFVIEDSVTKVTSDGEPHEMMTVIAGLSGLVAAIAILSVLIFLVACKKSSNQNSKHECDKCSESGGSIKNIDAEDKIRTNSNASSIGSCTVDILKLQATKARQSDVSIIYGQAASLGAGNLQGNLNKAFEGSELNLQNILEKPKKIAKKTHWQDELEQQRETKIEIERY